MRGSSERSTGGAGRGRVMAETPIDHLLSEVEKLVKALDYQTKELRRCEEALRFYAEPANWRTTRHPSIDGNDTPIVNDRGVRAREALGETCAASEHHSSTDGR